ncbi:hypothetical protein CROQUDRAFT_100142 [Cronartium quercuum f. sp. fusiforme G11]|uniref:Uncharacterized protein n=1 Tax=Cronartium quercuum f. sp. fusiforme G11 TaxID=708437 RepID=A0A9P6NAY4_9BASI|nr:hypothetical protein CROQUDRAFT_100142 [Cronartium quercuum f. sp. fusiforme G11]
MTEDSCDSSFIPQEPNVATTDTIALPTPPEPEIELTIPTITTANPSRPSQSTKAPLHYGNLVTNHTMTSDDDTPSYAKALKYPHASSWKEAMVTEYNSLVSHQGACGF